MKEELLNITMKFGDKLRILRSKQRLTQTELANQLMVTRPAITKWETGSGYPNHESLLKITSFFHVTIDSLLDDESEIVYENSMNKRKHLKIDIQKVIGISLTFILLVFLCIGLISNLQSSNNSSIRAGYISDKIESLSLQEAQEKGLQTFYANKKSLTSEAFQFEKTSNEYTITFQDCKEYYVFCFYKDTITPFYHKGISFSSSKYCINRFQINENTIHFKFLPTIDKIEVVKTSKDAIINQDVYFFEDSKFKTDFSYVEETYYYYIDATQYDFCEFVFYYQDNTIKRVYLNDMIVMEYFIIGNEEKPVQFAFGWEYEI